ncbi:MAG TPA: SUMF1/EgtB/PvdO family nonheme iron enzyme [Anaerolineales bacterium]|nr:SUMF1/EgtB/PvdO family nonheme iron enzyme [Anaerolineales bacterium]
MKIGRYEVERELGRGGMAVVHLARDPLMKRQVAVKVMPRLSPEIDTQFRVRFEREAQIIASLEHPSIVPVHDFGYAEEQPFIVMRYMAGGSLEERIKNQSVSPGETIRIFQQIAPAMDYAHHRGIIHRDLKPANILFDSDNNAFVADFGVAKMSEASTALTGSGIIGTPAYMSPEQAMGKLGLDGRSDVYSLGVVLFIMLTGKLPFEGDTPMSLAVAHIMEPVPNILKLRPDLPGPYKELIEQAMAKEREHRFETVSMLVFALEKAERSAQKVAETVKVPSKQKVVKRGDSPEDLEKIYLQGLSAFWLNRWEEAKACFDAIIASDPDYKDVASKLTEVEHRLQIGELSEQGKTAFDSGDWQAALTALNELVKLDPSNEEAANRLKEVQLRLQVAALYAEAKQLHEARQWQAVINLFARLESLTPKLDDPQGLLAGARKALAEEKRDERLRTLYNQALLAMNAGNWEEAQQLFKKIEIEAPNYGDTKQLLARVQAEIGSRPVEEKRQKISKPEKPPGKRQGKKLPAWVGVVGVLALGVVVLGLWLLSPKQQTPAEHMSPIPAGPFEMGSQDWDGDERPIHPVILGEFLIDQFEVTNEAYAVFLNDMGNQNEEGETWLNIRTDSVHIHQVGRRWQADEGYENHPVTNVTWYGAQAYCAWREARLPTEAEWEKAARGGLEGEIFPWGAQFPDCALGSPVGAQYNVCGDNPLPVGSFGPNRWELFDMVGNVWEWVADWYDGAYYFDSPEANPQGPPFGEVRVIRGGSWSTVQAGVRVANRDLLFPAHSSFDVGFRCAKNP